MKRVLALNPPPAGEAAAVDFDLAQWLGRREAFGAIGGRCSATGVECLRRIREEKLYRNLARNWGDFCSRYLGLDRSTIDGNIRHLKEFGPAFFHLAHLTSITPQAYRAIAPHVSADGVSLDGEVIAFMTQNSRKLAHAVATLCRRVQPERVPKAATFGVVLKRCQSIAVWLEALTSRLDPDQQAEIHAILRRIDAAARRVGVEFMEPQRWE